MVPLDCLTVNNGRYYFCKHHLFFVMLMQISVVEQPIRQSKRIRRQAP